MEAVDWVWIADGVVIALLLGAVAMFRVPRHARIGNGAAALAMLVAIVGLWYRHGMQPASLVVLMLAAGTLAGLLVAHRVSMIQIPSLVAFQHGAGGVAACLVSFVELVRLGGGGSAVGQLSGLLGLVIGGFTASGSVIASGKLLGVIGGRRRMLPGHGALVSTLAVLLLGLLLLASAGGTAALLPSAVAMIVLAALAGVLVALRVGGADMPVLISTLNATAGMAAAMCGIIVGSHLLVACGSIVTASGTVLTLVMCRAMNRSLLQVLTGITPPPPSTAAPLPAAAVPAEPAELLSAVPAGVGQEGGTPLPPQFEPLAAALALRGQEGPGDAMTGPGETPDGRDSAPSDGPASGRGGLEDAVAAAKTATRVIFVPGYGMALASAQFKVVELAGLLEQQGTEVKFAIHPVAGRMPGHMNVLLAEADLSYDLLLEMDEANPLFPDTDLVVVVGACDVVNPAAVQTDGTPISGMPILHVHRARKVVVCNLDDRPGYSGVENPLYRQPGVILLLGDARCTMEGLIECLIADR